MIILEQYAGEGKQAALRRCFQHAGGEIIYLTDADCILNDEAFERTLAPILRGEADVATGGSRPLPGELDSSLLARYRWAADLYASARAGDEVHGLLGRNAALTRAALEKAGAFQSAVTAGTDYHLAKSLLAQGFHIRNVPESEVESSHAVSLAEYWRQQRRWLRNVAVLGMRFGAHQEMAASLRTSVIGLGMITLPLMALLVGPAPLGVWLMALCHSSLSKWRYLRFCEVSHRLGPKRRSPFQVVQLPGLTLWESFVGASTLLDYAQPSRRLSWQ
jgi:cellulose synthase/poly-beta-1,6-N-acetylglucosamine synthase-like glycosyltransferase